MASLLITLINKPTWLIGLLQALALITYVVLFVVAAFVLEPNIRIDTPIIGATLFLTAFVTSALICGSLILGLPALLVIKGQIKNAILLLTWSAAWLVIILTGWVIFLAAVS